MRAYATLLLAALVLMGLGAPIASADGPTNAIGANVGRISAGPSDTCAFTTGGSGNCFGYGGDRAASFPGGPNNLRAISAGGSFACGLRNTGMPVCDGDNSFGQTSVPGGLTTATRLSAGLLHACAIDAAGAITCWGASGYGRTTPPTDANPFVAISAGREFTCALTSVGRPFCWGRNLEGQTTISTIPGDNLQTGVKSIDAGGWHTCAVRSDNTVACWGENLYGKTTVPAGLTAKTVVAGIEHSCAIKLDNTVECWGNNSFGQASPPGNLGPVLALDSNGYHTCAIKTDGLLACWGENGNGRATPPNVSFTWSAVPAAPVLTGTTPASPGGSLTPALTGSAWDDTLVSVYPNADCTGPTETGSTSANLAAGEITVTVPADATTTLSAKVLDQAGNWSGCSNSVSYTHTTPPPPAPTPSVDPPAPAVDPPALLPPTPTCAAPAAPKRKAGLGLTVKRTGRNLTIRVRPGTRVRVTVQAPCGTPAAVKTRRRAWQTVVLPSVAAGTLVTVRARQGKRTALATVRVG